MGLSLVRWFIPEAERSRVDLLRAELFVALSFLAAANAVLFGGLHLAHDQPGTGGGVRTALAGLFVAHATFPFLLRGGVPLRVLAPLMMVAMQVGVAAVAVNDGGLRSGAVFWLAVAPLAAAFIGGPKLGGAAAVVSIGAGLAMTAATMGGHVFSSTLSASDASLHYAINFVSVAAFVAAVAWIYEEPMVRHERALSERLSQVNEGLQHELAERQRAQRAAEAAGRAKDALLQNMSHEFRTPLTAVLGFADVLREEAPADLVEFADTIHGSGQRLLATLDGVLTLAAVESGELDVRLEPTEVGRVAAAAVDGLRPMAADAGLVLDLRADRAVAQADAAALNRVLAAVIENAVRFTDRGGVAVTVGEAAGRVAIEVADTGCGMTPEFVAHATDPFRQASSGDGRTHEGCGLGLAIARGLIHAMEGTFRIQSQVGVGTVVRVELPAVRDEAGTVHRLAA